MTLLRYPVLALAIALACTAVAAQDSHLRKAEAVVDALLEIDGREQAKLAVEDLLRQTGEYEFRAEYEEFFLSLGQSPDYRAAKSRAYSEAFTEPELEELLQLARTPVFRKFQERTPVLQRASRAAFAATMRPKFLEFAQKIEALKQARQRR